MIAVCDAFCAMTEIRPYENAWPIEKAVARLRSMPAQYDAEVVSALGKMLEAKEHGWWSEDTKVDDPVNVVSKASPPGPIHPRSAFFAAVYPVATR